MNTPNVSNDNPFEDKHLRVRHLKSNLILWLARFSLLVTVGFLAFFLTNIISTAMPAFKQAYIKVDVSYSEAAQKSPRKAVDKAYYRVLSRAWLRMIPRQMQDQPELLGKTVSTWVLADDEVDQYLKGHHNKLKEKQQVWLRELEAKGELELRFNREFFNNGDSKIPEAAGISAAIWGSVATLFVTMVLAFPLGVMTAIYLEEFAKDSMLNHFIEVNINNLAAVPSILFGLLGLSVFIGLFGLPRSSPLVGGITLALMTLPIIIVSARAALRSVPDSIRQAGYGLGLTRLQVVTGQVLPIAMPGILTGSIIGLAQAMGETAPLIIIGMIAFIPEAPSSLSDAATVLPAQIFTWAGMPERAYVEKTAAGILVILLTLVLLNSAAVYLRKRYEIKW
jgi:phosphate transport system permease protein